MLAQAVVHDMDSCRIRHACRSRTMTFLTFIQELRDLLDPTRHLKLREDPKQGFFVEGGKEETVVSLEHALAVVHVGQHYRTVSRLCRAQLLALQEDQLGNPLVD